jgi:hypothetical protein
MRDVRSFRDCCFVAADLRSGLNRLSGTCRMAMMAVKRSHPLREGRIGQASLIFASTSDNTLAMIDNLAKRLTTETTPTWREPPQPQNTQKT